MVPSHFNASFGYTRDAALNPTGTWDYDYDTLNRLAEANAPDGPVPGQPAGGLYSYDWVGNMKAKSATLPWQYNNADQLLLWPGMHSYAYDNNGALTAVKNPTGSVVQESFTYHPSQLMDTATFHGGSIANVWTADEQRVQFTLTGPGAGTYTAVFDQTAGIPAVLRERQPDGSYVNYIREPGGELLMRSSGASAHYYHYDELGSTRLLTNSSGAVTDTYTYDAYGSLITHNRSTGSVDQPYQYVGRLGYYPHQSPDFRWLQLGVRFYQPDEGRFERRDPIVRYYQSPFNYADANPYVLVDPDGRSPQDCHALGYLECLADCIQYVWGISSPGTTVEIIIVSSCATCLLAPYLIIPCGVCQAGLGLEMARIISIIGACPVKCLVDRNPM